MTLEPSKYNAIADAIYRVSRHVVPSDPDEVIRIAAEIGNHLNVKTNLILAVWVQQSAD